MANHQHGSEGAFIAGEWLSIEECVNHFKERKSDCKNDCSLCPRSASCEPKVDHIYDVAIIGAGCIGSAIARELSKTANSVILLEAADDVSQGATKGNSGIVHAGYDDTPGSQRAKFCWKGNQMFTQLDKELNFGYQKNGSLVLARGPEEEKMLLKLKQKGELNGVERLRILTREEVFACEPHVHPDTTAALLAPDAGNLIPYEYAIALAENAADNGVEIRVRREVVAIDVNKESGDGKDVFDIQCRHWEPEAYAKTVLPSSGSTTPTAPTSNKDNNGNKSIKPDGDEGMSVWMKCVIVGGVLLGGELWLAASNGLSSQMLWRFRLILIVLCGCLAMFGFKKSHDRKSDKPKVASSPRSSSLQELTAAAPNSQGQGSNSGISVHDMAVGGSGSSSVMKGKTVCMETVRARYIVNAAGSASDKIAKMIGDDSFKIKPRVGDYILLNKNQGHLAKHTLFPCPGPLGKGVLVQTTLWGNLILGPTARDMDDPVIAAETPEEIQSYIFTKCKELVPSFDVKETIHAFSGVRAKSTRGDWILEPSSKHPHFILAAGIDSPGLAGSPAIAIHIAQLLHEAGLPKTVNPTFNPKRNPLVVPKSGWKGIRAGPVGKFTNPDENIICKCEKVTESEVIAAIRGSLPVDSTQAVRKRTRAGMGHCQGDKENYNCEARVAAIIARELNIPIEAVGRRPWPATSTLPQRWMVDEQKQKLAEIKGN